MNRSRTAYLLINRNQCVIMLPFQQHSNESYGILVMGTITEPPPCQRRQLGAAFVEKVVALPKPITNDAD